jgi:flagellar hook-length control protein FliK
MKITNDVNNNSDFLSIANKGEEDTSLLGSLFSMNFNINELKSKDISDDFEFVFKKEDIEILDYLSNILPNLNINNLGLADLKKIQNEIETDQNLKAEVKDKLLSILDTAKGFNKNFFINLPEYQKLKALNNKSVVDNKIDPRIKKESSNDLPSVLKKMEHAINQSKQKSTKSNIINKNTGEIKFENNLENQTTINSNNTKLNFVKKINKNDHPNKLYQISNSNSFKYKEKLDPSSLLDSKLSNNTNLNYINNRFGDELKKNNMNEIKANDKVFNIQSSSDTSNKGNQFAQQNSTSFSNSGVNSILEGLLDSLDLSQKGWTTKLVSRIENALENGGEEIEFNLKPKNLGRLKVFISLNNGTGHVKIITENSFVTNALTQNENHLQKLFNDQGINLEFSANDDTQYLGSKNSFNKNSNKNDQNNYLKSDNEKEKQNKITDLDDNVSSRHIVNVIA